ncbi:MAG: PRC-barrel domain-containing protein [Clostridia bacterium]|nr:PRC-barrel domain-containing protein [Clostridia bacterium]
MSLLSEIISKPVLNLYSGKIEGTIKNVCFDANYKKVQTLKMFDDNEEEYFIYTDKIYKLGENSVVIKNNEALTLCINNSNTKENNPINQNVYTLDGEYKGRLIDIELSDKLETQTLLTNTGANFKINNLLNIGENIIVNMGDKKISFSSFKPKIKKTKISNKNTNIITIMPKEQINNEQEKQTPPQIEQIEKIENKPSPQPFKIHNQPTPQKLIGNGSFLIGRKAIKTIYGINNEIIIKKDNIISAKNLESAKKHSKLVELTVFSKIKA